jgi:alpha-tubulin suppressor-like RCC1 family protein
MADSQPHPATRLRSTLLGLSLAATVLITACGGGGGGDTPAPEGTTPITTPTAPVTTPTAPITTPTAPVTTPTTPPVTTPTTPPVVTPTTPPVTPTTPPVTPTTPPVTPTTPPVTPTTPPVTPTTGVRAEADSSKAAGFAYKLDASRSATLEGRTIASYLWNFGDGSTELAFTPVTHHMYRAGNYSVTVVITDSAGATATTAIGITATGPATPKLFSGYEQNFAVGANGAIVLWGNTTNGNATGNFINSGATGTATTATLLGNNSVTFIAVGMNTRGSNCFISVDGSVRCSGANTVGQLGNSTISASINSNDLYATSGLTSGVLEVAASENYSCARSSTDVKCWGIAPSRSSYDTRVNPTAVAGWGADIASIAAGHNHVCAINNNGAASCIGNNTSGQLGGGQVSLPNSSPTTAPVNVIGLSNRAIQILPNRSLGLGATCALNVLGQVECWGANTYNMFGRSDTVVSSTAPTLMNTAPEKFAQLVVGEDHLCGLGVSGKVYCWGYNNQKQVSQSVAGNIAPVTEVTGLSNVVQLSAGQGHSCALQSDNQIFCWGKNFNGNIGNGTITNAPLGVTRVVGSPF